MLARLVEWAYISPMLSPITERFDVMDHHETTAISVEEAEKNFGRYQDEAANGPVLIAQEGRPTTVLMSYDEFVRLKGNDRRAYRIEDCPPDLARAILDAEVPDDLEETPSRSS